LVIAAVSLFGQQPGPSYKSSPFLRIDPDKVVITDASGQKPCADCHRNEWQVWKDTRHAQMYDSLTRMASAKQYMQALGLRTTKRQDAICMRCHYTVGPDRTAIAGVSCESCHGAARDWINVHNKFAPGVRDRTQESPVQHEQRVAASRAGGMLRPSTDIYAVAANCFECHTVPMEIVVNKAGHSSGTRSFDLVSMIDSIRHNFLNPGGPVVNRPNTPEQKRVLFVIGRMLAYEYALRGMSTATVDSTYSDAMNVRAKRAFTDLQTMNAAQHLPAVDSVMMIARKVKLVPNNRAELEHAADQIREIGQRFASGTNGSTLAALDPVISGHPVAAPVEQAPVAATPPAASAPATGAGVPATARGSKGATPQRTTAASTAPASAPAPAAAPPAHVELPGRIRNRPEWFNASGRSGYLGVDACARCHGKAMGWWNRDPHSESASKHLLGEDPKARRIADTYGIGAAGMARPDNMCMSCHATVDEGRKVQIETGVSCESCHGAASGWKDSHQKGNNPQPGMRNLKQAADRAQTCSGCHRITDERLIAAGHTTGANYDFAKANEKIKHWPDAKADQFRAEHGGAAYQDVPAAALTAAFAAAVQSRPIPKVAVAAAPTPPPVPASISARSPAEVSPSAADTPSPTADAHTPIRPYAHTPKQAPTLPSRIPPSTRSTPVTLDLPPLPPTAHMTTEDLLLLVKKRIERIQAAIAGRN